MNFCNLVLTKGNVQYKDNPWNTQNYKQVLLPNCCFLQFQLKIVDFRLVLLFLHWGFIQFLQNLLSLCKLHLHIIFLCIEALLFPFEKSTIIILQEQKRPTFRNRNWETLKKFKDTYKPIRASKKPLSQVWTLPYCTNFGLETMLTVNAMGIWASQGWRGRSHGRVLGTA